LNYNPDRLEDFMRELTRHQSRLRGLLRCLLFDAADIEDVWQDTNVMLLRKAEEFQVGTNFWAWASTVARFQVLTYCKTKGRDRLVFQSGVIDLIAEDVIQLGDEIDVRRDALQECLQKLPSPQRQLLEIRYGAGSSLPQIAEQVNRPVGSIRQTLYRIREALLVCIERRISTEPLL